MQLTKTHKQYLLVSASFLAAFSFSNAKADMLNGAGGSWQSASSWNQSDLVISSKVPGGTLGSPYWNNYSGDGPKGNIGWCLTGGSTTCTMSNSPGKTLGYYGTNTGGSVGNMYFTSSGAPLTLSLEGVHTNETQPDFYDVFGYYLLSSPTTLHPLLNSNGLTNGPITGDTTTLNLASGTNYGFYIENIKGQGTPFQSEYLFFMDSAMDQDLSLGPDGLQHFAVFQNGSNYLIGEVDGVGCPYSKSPACVDPSDFDFQDMIVNVGPTVPEPATLGLLGTGVLLFGGLLRRKLRKSA